MNNKPIILVVDDEQTNIDIVSKILNNQYDLRVAYNGKKALAAIEKIEIDLILLDIQIPDFSGFEVAKEIRKKQKYDHIPIIFLSSQRNEDSIVEGFDIGGNDYIVKPFNAKELIARIQTHLHVHQLQKLLETMLNLQSTIVILSENNQLKFINKTGLDFFTLNNNSEFLENFNCICDVFLESDGYFYHQNDNLSWINEILKLPLHERNVVIKSKKGMEKVFQVSVQTIPTSSMQIINFVDVTASIKNQKHLEEQITRDPLTGAYNRTFLEQNMTTKPNAIAFLDIDYFKKINDNYGHHIGDTVLKEFVTLIQNSLRQSDIFIRWGGEEFVIFLPLNEESSVQKVCNKLCQLVEDHTFSHVGHFTCSIGVTLLKENETIEKAIERADMALYTSKSNGRNQVTLL
ncbi:GGDEF domain-containing response regulator [Sulfurimonas sp.]|uniref:GGDEF domain-containing response regulator n=1 Tax=Sulfurimonas sp. TaxID=2022749 RepID=UPI003D0D1BD2